MCVFPQHGPLILPRKAESVNAQSGRRYRTSKRYHSAYGSDVSAPRPEVMAGAVRMEKAIRIRAMHFHVAYCPLELPPEPTR